MCSDPTVEVITIPGDTEGSGDDDIIEVDGREYHAHLLSVDTDPDDLEFINRAFEQVEERDSR